MSKNAAVASTEGGIGAPGGRQDAPASWPRPRTPQRHSGNHHAAASEDAIKELAPAAARGPTAVAWDWQPGGGPIRAGPPRRGAHRGHIKARSRKALSGKHTARPPGRTRAGPSKGAPRWAPERVGDIRDLPCIAGVGGGPRSHVIAGGGRITHLGLARWGPRQSCQPLPPTRVSGRTSGTRMALASAGGRGFPARVSPGRRKQRFAAISHAGLSAAPISHRSRTFAATRPLCQGAELQTPAQRAPRQCGAHTPCARRSERKRGRVYRRRWRRARPSWGHGCPCAPRARPGVPGARNSSPSANVDLGLADAALRRAPHAPGARRGPRTSATWRPARVSPKPLLRGALGVFRRTRAADSHPYCILHAPQDGHAGEGDAITEPKARRSGRRHPGHYQEHRSHYGH